jgi:hypothetical protein
VSRRADPLAVAMAQREGQLQRLMSEGMSRESAELWERAWYAHATYMHIEPTAWDYWERGLSWIAEQRSARNGAVQSS